MRSARAVIADGTAIPVTELRADFLAYELAFKLMSLPKVDAKYFQERTGVHIVGSLLSAARLIFRETDHGDVGIDGQAELVDDNGEATGATIAVQIKSGSSYLRDGGEYWKYYPADRHRTYWESFPLPVVLLLHDPENNTVYWVDARQQLRSDQHKQSFLSVPKSNVLSAGLRQKLFESCGTAGRGLLTIDEALRHLTITINPNAAFRLSFLDMFLEGLTDIGRKVFFSAGMCWELAETRVPEDSLMGPGMGPVEYDFIDRYIRLLVEQSLAHIDYADVLIDVRDRGLVPTILVPLTSRGRLVRDLCRELGSCGLGHEITEATVGLMDGPHLWPRREANLAVAKKLTEYFNGPGAIP